METKNRIRLREKRKRMERKKKKICGKENKRERRIRDRMEKRC